MPLHIEIGVNGQTIGAMVVRNRGPVDDVAPIRPDGSWRRYEYVVTHLQSERVTTGEVVHRREDGAARLIALIMDNAAPWWAEQG